MVKKGQIRSNGMFIEDAEIRERFPRSTNRARHHRAHVRGLARAGRGA